MIDGSIDANLIDKLLPPFVMGVFAVAFFILWFNRRQFASALMLAASYAAGMAAFSLEASYCIFKIQGSIPFVGDILYTTCSALFTIALVKRLGGRSVVTPAIAIMGLSAIGHGYFRFVEPDLMARVQVISFSCVFVMALTLPTLVRTFSRLTSKLLLVQVSILAVAIVLSTIYSIDPATDGLNEIALRDSLYMSLINMTVTAMSLTIAVTLYMNYVTSIVDELKMQSETDALTGLLNRRGFEARAASFFDDNRNLPVVMIVADIDHFKSINDRHGHSVGDKVLKHLSSIMRDGVRQSDICGRIGGEEFCILMPGAELPIGRLAAENMRSVFAQTAKHIAGCNAAITASFGVCEVRDGESYMALFERADTALYSAKQQGRDRVCTQTKPIAVNDETPSLRA